MSGPRCGGARAAHATAAAAAWVAIVNGSNDGSSNSIVGPQSAAMPSPTLIPIPTAAPSRIASERRAVPETIEPSMRSRMPAASAPPGRKIMIAPVTAIGAL